MSDCRHLIETEAYRVGPEGDQSREVGHLCVWADAHPDRFINAPRWITNPALASILIRPESDCAACPGYEKRAAP